MYRGWPGALMHALCTERTHLALQRSALLRPARNVHTCEVPASYQAAKVDDRAPCVQGAPG